jgi:hypothetical protein
LAHFCPTENSSRIKTRSQFSSISKDSKGNFLIKVSLRYEESIQYLVIGEVEKENRDWIWKEMLVSQSRRSTVPKPITNDATWTKESSRAVGNRGQGEKCPPPDFGRLVNLISGQIIPTKLLLAPPPSRIFRPLVGSGTKQSSFFNSLIYSLWLDLTLVAFTLFYTVIKTYIVLYLGYWLNLWFNFDICQIGYY